MVALVLKALSSRSARRSCFLFGEVAHHHEGVQGAGRAVAHEGIVTAGYGCGHALLRTAAQAQHVKAVCKEGSGYVILPAFFIVLEPLLKALQNPGS